LRYIAGWPDTALLARLFARMANEAGIATTPLPGDLRLRRAGDLIFAFNYGLEPVETETLSFGKPIIGDPICPPAGVVVWRG
ncbi:MAG: beta-galactosidase, partial [Sphingomonas hengshuiensis]